MNGGALEWLAAAHPTLVNVDIADRSTCGCNDSSGTYDHSHCRYWCYSSGSGPYETGKRGARCSGPHLAAC